MRNAVTNGACSNRRDTFPIGILAAIWAGWVPAWPDAARLSLHVRMRMRCNIDAMQVGPFFCLGAVELVVPKVGT